MTSGTFVFSGHFEHELAPKTCKAFGRHMPFRSKIVHARWSGEGVWVPLNDLDFGIGFENSTCYPAPGQIVLYPGGVSETEILLAYGNAHFSSKAGQLPANHFITLTSGLENLDVLGRKTLWEGAQDIVVELA